MGARPRGRRFLIVPVALCTLVAGAALARVQELCGPFTDVSPTLCPYVTEMYYLGITAGTSATTFSPDATMTRGQAAVFVSKGINQALARSSRRAGLGQWWTTTPHWDLGLGVTSVGAEPALLQSDGSDLWVPNFADGTVSRIRQSDGRLLETWTGATNAYAAVIAGGRVLITQDTTDTESAGALYMIDPSLPPGDVVTVATNLGLVPLGIAFDGTNVWTANYSNGAGGGSVSIVTPSSNPPWSVSTVTTGFVAPQGILFDGANVWISDAGDNHLKKLDSAGAILMSVPVGISPGYPVFDGANIWVPNLGDATVSVVHASTGLVVATLTGNGLSQPLLAGFDGQRVLVTNPNSDVLSLFRAADFAPLGSFSSPSGTAPYGVCSDGVQFWIGLLNGAKVARF